MEACSGAYYGDREIGRPGHDVRLILPAYVKPFVKRQKSDASNTEAICKAASYPACVLAVSARMIRALMGPISGIKVRSLYSLLFLSSSTARSSISIRCARRLRLEFAPVSGQFDY